MPLDPHRFPRVAAYLDALDGGIDAHPHAQVKGSVLRAAIDDRPLGEKHERLPIALAALLVRPPLVSSWVPSVHAQALFLAYADAYTMTDTDFGDWTYRLQKRLYSSALYRAVAAVATPRMLLLGAERRWGAIHRGTALEVVDEVERDTATAIMLYPRGLYARTNLVGFARGLQAVLELSNARIAHVDIKSSDSTRTSFELRWRERG